MKASNITISTIIKAPGRIERLAGNRGEYCFLFFCSLFILGTAAGAVFISRNGDIAAEFLRLAIKEELLSYSLSGFWRVFLLTAAPKLCIVAIVFILSSCALGTPLIFSISALFGAGFGCVCGAAYQSLGFKGIVFILTSLALPAIVFSLSLFSFSFTAVVASVELFRIAYSGRSAAFSKINEAVVKALLRCLVITIISSFLEGVGFTVFGGVFR